LNILFSYKMFGEQKIVLVDFLSYNFSFLFCVQFFYDSVGFIMSCMHRLWSSLMDQTLLGFAVKKGGFLKYNKL
jgi:hypothetical protein